MVLVGGPLPGASAIVNSRRSLVSMSPWVENVTVVRYRHGANSAPFSGVATSCQSSNFRTKFILNSIFENSASLFAKKCILQFAPHASRPRLGAVVLHRIFLQIQIFFSRDLAEVG